MTPDETIRDELIALLPRLRRFALDLTGSRAHADNLVQNACELALKNLQQYKANTTFDNWMFHITKTIWLDTRRARKTQGQTVVLNADERETKDYSKGNVGNRQFLAVVSKPCKAARRATYCPDPLSLDGLPYKEVAAILEIPAGTVMSQLASARRRLHELIS